jgi:SnoaL-like protein
VTTTREVFDRHLSHQLDRDLDAILTDYAPDAVVVGPDGIGSGHDHIRAAYEQVLPLMGALDLTSVQVEGEVVYVNFRARNAGRDDLVGTDTFVIRDGLIHVHTFYATTEKRGRRRPVVSSRAVCSWPVALTERTPGRAAA